MAILVMLNNLLHDFAVAMLFCAMLTMIFLRRSKNVERAYRRVKTVMVWAFGFIVLFGIGRTLAYRQYEWHEAAGSGQVASLVIKHIILGGLVLVGAIYLLKNRR